MRYLRRCDFLGKKVNIKWRHHVWDGMISGFGEYRGKLVYLSSRPISNRSYFKRRHYRVYTLTSEQEAFERMVHTRFQEYVGYNNDFPAPKDRPILHPQENWSGFYEWAKENAPPFRSDEYETQEYLGWTK